MGRMGQVWEERGGDTPGSHYHNGLKGTCTCLRVGCWGPPPIISLEQ